MCAGGGGEEAEEGEGGNVQRADGVVLMWRAARLELVKCKGLNFKDYAHVLGE